MKKNDWILIGTVAAYSFLFYKESAGINFTVFTLVLIAALLIRDKQLIKQTTWKVAAVTSLLSSLCIGYYGTGLAITANIVSLSLLSAVSYSSATSILVSLLFSFYSFASALVMMFIDWQSRKLKQQTESKIKWKLILVPIAITILFFLMYRSSNALFNNFAKNLNLDFLSWHWIFFTLGGLILLYGFFYHQQIEPLADLDKNASNEIKPNDNREFKWFGKTIPVNDEEFSGKLLFILLNILLLIVNGLDIQFMFISKQLPQGITYSEFVHQGTGMLITSIIIAIAIILFYFRGALNFSEKSKFIKALAYLWILQNAFMILSTAFRNNMYVVEYGLTYKRIGVYVYLLLTLVGLSTTAIKILKHKSEVFLFRVNGWIFFGILMVAPVINWDRVIADFNIHKAKQTQAEYLLGLSYTSLPKLYAYETAIIPENKSKNSKEDERWFRAFRDKRLYYFLESGKELSWKSWYMDHENIHRELQELNANQKITKLNLWFSQIQSLEALHDLDQLRDLDVSENVLNDGNELRNFPALQKLNLRSNRLTSLQGLEVLKNLERLDVSRNPVSDYNPLYELKKLKSLTVDSSITTVQYEKLKEQLKETIILKK